MSWHLGKTFATKSFLHTHTYLHPFTRLLLGTDCRHCVQNFFDFSHFFCGQFSCSKLFNAFIYTHTDTNTNNHTLIRKDTVMTIIVRYWWKEWIPTIRNFLFRVFLLFFIFLSSTSDVCLFVFNWHWILTMFLWRESTYFYNSIMYVSTTN